MEKHLKEQLLNNILETIKLNSCNQNFYFLTANFQRQ